MKELLTISLRAASAYARALTDNKQMHNFLSLRIEPARCEDLAKRLQGCLTEILKSSDDWVHDPIFDFQSQDWVIFEHYGATHYKSITVEVAPHLTDHTQLDSARRNVEIRLETEKDN